MESVVESCPLFGDVLCMRYPLMEIRALPHIVEIEALFTVAQYLSYIQVAMIRGVLAPVFLLRSKLFHLP